MKITEDSNGQNRQELHTVKVYMGGAVYAITETKEGRLRVQKSTFKEDNEMAVYCVTSNVIEVK